jgi:hypothetical protein
MVHLQLQCRNNKNNYFNFAEGRNENTRETEELGAVVCKRGDAKRGKSVCGAVSKQT